MNNNNYKTTNNINNNKHLAESFFSSENTATPTTSADDQSGHFQLNEEHGADPQPIYTTPARPTKNSRIPQPTTSTAPKKGILKWPPQQNYSPSAEIQPYPNESGRPSILERFMMIQALVDPPQTQQIEARNVSGASTRPTVEFSERNAIAIYGDTSDECLTETDNLERQTVAQNNNFHPTSPQISSLFPRKFGNQTLTTAVVSPIRQMGVFFSEDSEESSETGGILRHEKPAPRPSPLTINRAPHLKTINEVGATPNTVAENVTETKLSPLNGRGESDIGYDMSKSGSLSPLGVTTRKVMGDSMISREPSTTEDDSHSMTSSNGSANVVGKWWFGKNTRYVVHCERKGCNHKNHEPNKLSDYLTPTQRKNKEIGLLTRQLKRCETELEDKNKQLIQLRERLKEIETMMASSQALSENVRLLQRQREREEEFRSEKEQLIERHEIRVRQLIQETVDARSEMLRKAQQLEKLKAELDVEKVEQSCMTDDTSMFHLADDLLSPVVRKESAGSQKAASATSRDQSPREECATAQSPPPLLNLGHQLQIALTQVEAYRNEALIWRTKTAQLEIALKELMLNSEQDAEDEENEDEAELLANSEATNEKVAAGHLSRDDQSMEKGIPKTTKITKSTSASNFGSIANLHSVVKTAAAKFGGKNSNAGTGECQNESCADRKRKLIDENKNLLERIDEQSAKIGEMETNLSDLGRKYDKKKAALNQLDALHAELGELAEERLSESKAAQMSLDRLQLERDKLNKAISYLESRCQVFQNVILDNNLVVRDDGNRPSTVFASQKSKTRKENVRKSGVSLNIDPDSEVITNSTTNDDEEEGDPALGTFVFNGGGKDDFADFKSAELRRGFADPDYETYYSKEVQTDLTTANLDSSNEEFNVLVAKLQEIEIEFSAERRRSAAELADVEGSLRVKTQLIEQLTSQLHEHVKREKFINEQHQHERDIYRKKMEELGKIAERVPILESEIDLALKAKSQLELSLRRTEHTFEDHLEGALADALKQRNESDTLWTQRLASVEEARANVEAQLKKVQHDFTELRLRHSVERAELEERLTSSINHITELNNRLNCPKRDVECEAKPKTMSKYVACRPNSRQKETQIVKGDLAEDVELVECRAELFKMTYELKFADDKIHRLEEKLMDALETAKRKQTPVPHYNLKHSVAMPTATHSFDRVHFKRKTDDVRISLSGSASSASGDANERYEQRGRSEGRRIKAESDVENDEGEEISTVSSPPVLINGGAPFTSGRGAADDKTVLDPIFAKLTSKQIEAIANLKRENEKYLTEIHSLKERLFELENEAYEKTKDKISHVSYLIPTKLDYDSCDNIELAVEICGGGRNKPIRPDDIAEGCGRASSLPPNAKKLAEAGPFETSDRDNEHKKRVLHASSFHMAYTDSKKSSHNQRSTPLKLKPKGKYCEKKSENDFLEQAEFVEQIGRSNVHGDELHGRSNRVLARKLSAPEIVDILSPKKFGTEFSLPSTSNVRMGGMPLIVPHKWDYERNALLQRNSVLSRQLSLLKGKVELALGRSPLLKDQNSVMNSEKQKVHFALTDEEMVENFKEPRGNESVNTIESKRHENKAPRVELSSASLQKKPIKLLEEIYTELEEMLKDPIIKEEFLSADLKNKNPLDNNFNVTVDSPMSNKIIIESGEKSRRLTVECESLARRLRDAEMELEIYRKEPREEAKRHLLGGKSQSVTDLTTSNSASIAAVELSKWKEIAGVMFRELNYLRNAISASETQRLEMKTQCAMLRGEIELAKCQNVLAKELSLRRRENLEKRRASLNSQKGVKKCNNLHGTIPGAPAFATLQRRASLTSLCTGDMQMEVNGINRKRSPSLAYIPNLSDFIDTVISSAMKTNAEGEIIDTNNGTHAVNAIQRLVPKNSAKNGTERALRKELEIIREAFQKQVGKLRSTNQNLERRVGDLETKVNESSTREHVNNEKRQRIEILEGENATLESECTILRAENEMYEKKIRDMEEERQQMYMVMFRKGQQAAQVEIQDDKEFDQLTEDRAVLKFLHDAFYYYLLGRGNSREHLQAIMTMLNFTNTQKAEIYQRRGKSH